jgi:hypothetical protein
LRLPAELRLEIYRLLLTGETIHIEGTRRKNPLKSYELRYDVCTANDAMQSLSHLTGASHAQDQSPATNLSTKKVCRSNHIFSDKGGCNDPVRLDVQLLRVCRQIYDEAMLLPYSENHFIITLGLYQIFLEEFVTQFSTEKRSAMHTVAVLRNPEEDLGLVSELLPGLKRLWFGISIGGYHRGMTFAVSQSKRMEAYSQIELSHLVGVTIEYDGPAADDGGMEERLELALLGKRSL